MSAVLHVEQTDDVPAASESELLPFGDLAGEYWRWCPSCGHELQIEHCKLCCPRCHYFLSCSDFD